MYAYIAFVILVVIAAVMFIDFKHWRLSGREGFEDFRVFTAKVTPGGTDEESVLSPAAAFDPASEKLVSSMALPAMSTQEAEGNWGVMTSETCYRSDIGESLKPTRNFLQRTNNYRHRHPDSCSAPNHEFVGTFYKPFTGVGMTPATGTKYPPSTQCMGEVAF